MLLEKAFNEGAVVIIDEMNSSPMMEHTLNAMLMGFHPETHERPLKPGFMLLGTQNPISMAGRRATSTALQTHHYNASRTDKAGTNRHT